MYSLRSIFVFVFFIGVSCNTSDIIVPCSKADFACMTESAKIALPKIVPGIPELGVESSDPLFLSEVIGEVAGGVLKFKFTNATLTGFKNCDISNVLIDWAVANLHFNLSCRDIVMTGDYTISGRLIVLPVEGEGPFRFHAKRYSIGIDGTFKIKEVDGKQYVNIKSFKHFMEAKEPIIYDMQNLFNGNKALGDPVIKFANENYKEVSDFVQEAAFTPFYKKVIKSLNKFLGTVPADKLFKD